MEKAVMAALVAAIHVDRPRNPCRARIVTAPFRFAAATTWMPATSAGMTENKTVEFYLPNA
jgi:hypothetical protein